MKAMGGMHWFGSAMVGSTTNDGHTWEIVRNAPWRIDERALVTFGV